MGNKRGAATVKGRGKGQEKKGSGRFSGMIDFVRGVRSELRRVNWPNRDQLQQSTAVVLVIVLVLAAYVALWDVIFKSLAKIIFA